MKRIEELFMRILISVMVGMFVALFVTFAIALIVGFPNGDNYYPRVWIATSIVLFFLPQIGETVKDWRHEQDTKERLRKEADLKYQQKLQKLRQTRKDQGARSL